MKTLLYPLAAAALALTLQLGATPDHQVTVEEQLSGSNESAFAVLRTETDNLASYYSSQRRVTLDERSKETGELLKSTLLLDVKHAVDANHNDPKTPAPVSQKTLAKDETITAADLLERYPPPHRKIWTEAELAKLETDPTAGIHFDRRVRIADGKQITDDVFHGRLAEVEWRIAGAFEDTNSVYFTLTKLDEDGSKETRLLCLPPSLTESIRAHQNRKPFYLVAGTFGTKEEAIRQAEAWLAKAREGKNFHFQPEVWSKWEQNVRIVHLVVQADSMQLIESGRLKALSELLGVDFTPESSNSFQERTKVFSGR